MGYGGYDRGGPTPHRDSTHLNLTNAQNVGDSKHTLNEHPSTTIATSSTLCSIVTAMTNRISGASIKNQTETKHRR